MPLVRVLSVAVASGRVGMVFVVKHELKHWEISHTATRSADDAYTTIRQWIDDLRPTVIVIEKCTEKCRKGANTRSIIDALAVGARRAGVLTLPVVRPREYKNKYDEAEAYAKKYPELRPWVPRRRMFFDSEPMNTVIFEALVLADAAHGANAVELAAAMDQSSGQ